MHKNSRGLEARRRGPTHATRRAVGGAIAALLVTACTGPVRRLSHAAAASLEEGASRAADDMPVGLTTWGRPSNRGAVVVALHSFGDYHNAFAELGDALAAQGHALISFDQRGFGASTPRGVFAGKARYVADLAATVGEARRRFPDRAVVILGESFGGSVALVALAEGAVRADGLVLAGPGVREDLTAKSLWDAAIHGAAALFGSTAFTVDRDDPALSGVARARLLHDPLVQREVRADTYSRTVELADEASLAASAITIPTLVLHGTADSLVPARPIAALMRRLGENGTLRAYVDRPHLVLQLADPAPREAVIDFVDAVAARRAGAEPPRLRRRSAS